MEEVEYKIWFARLMISNKMKLRLLNDFQSCKNVYFLRKNDLIEKKYNNKCIDTLFDLSYKKNLEQEKMYMIKNNIKIINIYDDGFPIKLIKIPDCPVQIFYKGNFKLLNNESVGIIGSRKSSNYGQDCARKIAKDFSKLGITVISGLAIGIDKQAHLGALDGRTGKTIAILGNGISKEKLYPYENLGLYERIIEENGCVISEYNCSFGANKYSFPARNRIISGLSDKIIVVEAGPKSGSLITVEYALEQGKDVYAVPGNIGNYNSFGTNKLIQEGAFPFLNTKDCFI